MFRHISHYTRVKQLMKRGLGNREIAHILGIADRVVFEYNRIAAHFHPDLAKKVTVKKNKNCQKNPRGTIGPIDGESTLDRVKEEPDFIAGPYCFTTIIQRHALRNLPTGSLQRMALSEGSLTNDLPPA